MEKCESLNSLEKRDKSIDIQNIGLILLRLMKGKDQFIESSQLAKEEAIRNEESEMFPNQFSIEIRQLVNWLLGCIDTEKTSIEKILRHPLIKDELVNIFEDLIPLTYNTETSSEAHIIIEKIVEIECLLAKYPDYNFNQADNTVVLRLANNPYTCFLVQAELKAID